MELETHISSVIIGARIEHFGELEHAVSQFPGAEIAAKDADQGKLVVILEQPSMDLLKQAIDALEQLNNVMSISMVYHHAESTASLNEAI